MKNTSTGSRSLMGQIPLESEFKGFRAVRSIINRLLHSAARSLPMFPAWRVAIHRHRGVNVGRGVFIGSDVFIDNTYPERITIEDYVTVISRTFIIGHTFHPLHLAGVLNRNASVPAEGVLLKKGCYIGAQCIILPGVTIGECAIVGAGSVVTESVPAYAVAVGVPARVVRQFARQDVLEEYLV